MMSQSLIFGFLHGRLYESIALTFFIIIYIKMNTYNNSIEYLKKRNEKSS